MDNVDHDVTKILQAASSGDRQAAEELIPLVYDELRQLAAWRLGQEAAPNTLQATALVHEAYLRLSPGENQWDGRAHFFCAEGEAMRRILVERARRRKAARHGGELRRTEWLEECIVAPAGNEEEVLAVHEVLHRLSEIKPRKAEVAKLRYFIGMTVEEIAEALGISIVTVTRDWVYAKAWLFREMDPDRENK